MQNAHGTFEVSLAAQPASDPAEGSVGRMTLDKQFHGDLIGTSRGEMLAVRGINDSAGYVAMERVAGSLQGRTGTFALQHSGTMMRGVPSLVVSVVPDSGTGELSGLSGSMTIANTDGKHLYTFDYTLTAP